MTLFTSRPWFRDPLPRFPTAPIGMLGQHEASLFFHVARDLWTGAGTVIDAGSFLGKSAFWLARGLQANPAFVPGRHFVHCFDNFLVNEVGTIEFVREYLGREMRLSESTRDVFDAQVAPVREVLQVHAGDFHTVPWTREPVEILMVDVAKTQSLGARVVDLFFRDLMPGKSIVLHQDWHHAWLPHIHVVMEFLADHFELVAPAVDSTAAFRCVRAIPEDVLQRVIRHDFTSAEEFALMDRVVARWDPATRGPLELARCRLWTMRGDGERALAALAVDRGGASSAATVRERTAVRDQALVSVATQRLENGDGAGALGLADELLLGGRTDAWVHMVRGKALASLGRFAEAETALRESLAGDARSGDACIALAQVLSERGAHGEAEAVLVRGLGDASMARIESRTYFEWLAQVWIRRGDAELAERTFTALRAAHGHDPEWWVLAARFAGIHGRVAESVEHMRQAAALGLAAARCAEVWAEMKLPPADPRS